MKNWLLNRHEQAQPLSFGGYVTRGLVAFFMLLFAYQLWILLHICWWIQFNPSSSAFMEDRLDVIQEKNPDAELKHKWVKYNKISIDLKRAVIASEDAKFLDHEGFDWEGIEKPTRRISAKAKSSRAAPPSVSNWPRIYFCRLNVRLGEKQKRRSSR